MGICDSCLPAWQLPYYLLYFSDSELWKANPETKEIAKLQQQFSDLKQWRLEEAARAHESGSSENTDEETGCEEEIDMQNAFSLLQLED